MDHTLASPTFNLEVAGLNCLFCSCVAWRCDL